MDWFSFACSVEFRLTDLSPTARSADVSGRARARHRFKMCHIRHFVRAEHSGAGRLEEGQTGFRPGTFSPEEDVMNDGRFKS